MILVCPSCEAKFKVPDGAIPPEGRKVRCASCKHSWHALPQRAPRPQPAARPKPAADMDAGLAARAAAVRRAVAEEAPQRAPSFDDDMFDEGPSPRPAASGMDDLDDGDDFGVAKAFRGNQSQTDGKSALPDGGEFDPDEEGLAEEGQGAESRDEEDYEDDDFLARRRAEQRRDAERRSTARRRRVLVIGWAGLLVFWIAVFIAFVFMKDTMVAKFPGLNSLYGMSEGANEIEQMRKSMEGKPLSTPLSERKPEVEVLLDRSTVEERGGQTMLVLYGHLRNKDDKVAATVPKVEARILDRNGKVLDSWIFNPPGVILGQQRTLNFEESRHPIPPGAAKAEVLAIEGTRSDRRAEAPK